MDNASIHNDDRLAQIPAQKNITLVKVPPYSYDLNLIEMVFGLVKAYSLQHRGIDNKAIRILTSFNDVQPQLFKTSTVTLGGYRISIQILSHNKTAFLKAIKGTKGYALTLHY